MAVDEIVLLGLLVVSSLSQANSVAAGLKEYCGFETFSPKCWGKEVIVMDMAVYGRRQLGRCIKASDMEELGEQARYIGCYSDVISSVDARCSGRQECDIRIPDPVLQQSTKCPQSLMMYMEASYHCVEVVQEDRSCVVSVMSSSLHIARSDRISASSASQSSTGRHCGTKSQPWLLEAPAGQRINVSLLDFTAETTSGSSADSRSADATRQARTNNSGSSGACTNPMREHQYGYIIDKSANNQKNVSICGSAGLQRLSSVYLSTSNTIELVSTLIDSSTTSRLQLNFLVKVEATGCTDLVPPEDAWIKRQDDKIVIGCYTSRQTWQLRCHNGRWIGVVSNCTQDHVLGSLESPSVRKVTTSGGDQYEVVVMVAICFAGLAVCLTIVCCGIVCWRRFQVKHQQNKSHHSRPDEPLFKANLDCAQFSTCNGFGNHQIAYDAGINANPSVDSRNTQNATYFGKNQERLFEQFQNV